jgi:hypothetical protein
LLLAIIGLFLGHIANVAFNVDSLQPTCKRKVILIKILSRGVRKDKGERGTIETENRNKTCTEMTIQVLEELRPKEPLTAKHRVNRLLYV